MTSDNIFYIIYSIVQGFTEFLPISSSGHLNMLELFFHETTVRNIEYETFAHFSSLLALILYLFQKNHLSVINIRHNFFPIMIATVPAVFVGLIIKLFDYTSISLSIIGYTSIAGGLLLYFSDSSKNTKINLQNRHLKYLVAGLFQCLAFLPGFSRSGACITAFRFLNENRENSSIQSIYLGLPIIGISFLSNLLEIKSLNLDFNIAIILIVTFVSAYLTLNLLIKFIEIIGFTPFVIYRILLGLILIFLIN